MSKTSRTNQPNPGKKKDKTVMRYRVGVCIDGHKTPMNPNKPDEHRACQACGKSTTPFWTIKPPYAPKDTNEEV